jgi:hypothetical protein
MKNKEFVAKLHTYMSQGQCLLLTVKKNNGNTVVEGVVTVYIAPLRLLGIDYEFENPYLSYLIVLTSEMNTKNFEFFLLYHELMMRSVRANIVEENLTKYLMPPHCKVNLRDATLQELYFGDADGNDIRVDWLNESLRTAKFDFTIPLQLVEMNENAVPHYTKENLKKYVNHIIMPHSVNQKGLEYCFILPTKEKDPDAILFVIQQKLSVTGAMQEKFEIESTSKKVIEVLTTDQAKEDGAAAKGLVKKYTTLGWPEEKIVILFLTNRQRREYQTAISGNILLMCEESLKNYLGPTLWDLLQSSYCLNNLKLGVNTNDYSKYQ